jgi:hypothetical protein
MTRECLEISKCLSECWFTVLPQATFPQSKQIQSSPPILAFAFFCFFPPLLPFAGLEMQA